MLQEKETWVSINNADNYMISNFGNVKSIDRIVHYKNGTSRFFKGRMLTPRMHTRGYLIISIVCNDGKYRTLYIHKLVAQHFINNPYNLSEVNHKNEDKTDNHDWNLEWCDRSYNINYGNRNNKVAKKLSKKVRCIETGVIYKSLHEAAKINNIGVNMIARCCNKQRNTTHGYHWEYA